MAWDQKVMLVIGLLILVSMQVGLILILLDSENWIHRRLFEMAKKQHGPHGYSDKACARMIRGTLLFFILFIAFLIFYRMASI